MITVTGQKIYRPPSVDGSVSAVRATSSGSARVPAVTVASSGILANRPTNPILINWLETFDPGVVTQDPALWAHPGALVVTGRTNYNDAWVHTIANGGATVLFYLDPIINMAGGRYHDKLLNASEFGPAVPLWPPGFAYNSFGNLNDIRTAADGGGVLQSKLPGVMQLMIDENPHVSGFFLDDVGTTAFFSAFNTWTSAEKAKYRRAGIAIAQSARNLADANNLFLVANGTWLADPQGGGYPNSALHGCSLLDGGCIENHPEDTFWDAYSNAAQWGQATPRKLAYGFAFGIGSASSYKDGWINHASHATYGSYTAGTPAPWGAFTDLGLPRKDVQPVGPPGTWSLKFEDHFTGTSLNTNVWEPFWYSDGTVLNNTPVHASNVSVSGGNLVLALPSSTSGSCVTSRPAGSRNGFRLGRPCVWEARVRFPGDGTFLYNWPAFWVLNDAAGQQNVEVDIAEPWDGTMQENYHCSGSNPSFNYPSYVGGAFHIYTLHRKATTYDLYVDGVLIHTVTKDAADDGLPQYVLFNNGRTTSGNHNAFGSAGDVLVDYVRAWS